MHFSHGLQCKLQQMHVDIDFYFNFRGQSLSLNKPLLNRTKI